MLILTLHRTTAIRIGGATVITIAENGNASARLAFHAPRDVVVERGVYDAESGRFVATVATKGADDETSA